MTPVVFIRHGITDWNLQGRIQGRTQTVIRTDSRARLHRWRIPMQWRSWDVYVSPLRRARQTALALGMGSARLAPALMEMDWGEWEGRYLAELRAELGAQMAANEARGLDFRPPGGESPRHVRARLRAWLSRKAHAGRPLLAISHKGVIDAALSLATGWDLQSAAPFQLDWSCAQGFAINRQGRLYLRRPDIRLGPGP